MASKNSSPIYLKNYPEYTKWDSPIETFPLTEIWENAVKEYPDNQVIAFMGTHITYAELDIEVTKMAAQLQKIGAKKGMHIGIYMANTPWYVICYQAILKIGGVVVNFNPLYTKKELEYLIKDSNIEIMLTLDLVLLCDKVIPLVGKEKLKQVIVCPFDIHLSLFKKIMFNIFKATSKAKIETSKTIHTFSSLDNNLPPIKKVKINVDDLAVLQYTGGTTGRAKGAALTHANLSANISQCIHWFPTFEKGKERVATFLPLFHVFAMTLCMNFTIKQGSCMIMLPRFELKKALKAMKQEKGTMFPGVPTIFQAITQLSDRQRKKLKDLKIAMSGGAGLPEDTKNTFESQTGVELVEGYGLSETSPVACANPFNGKSIPQCIGVPLPQTQISLRDLENPEKEVKNGEKGELCIKGPQVMKSYWKNEKATKESFTKDGFFRTGDVGQFDKKGFCYIVDRIKDLILRGGFNVYPRNIEEVILTHPDVAETIVIGIKDEYLGEKPKAFIKLKEESDVTEQEIMNFANSQLSKLEQFKDVEFREELPKTIIGKLSKKDLREEL
ncbi:MAG: long-chain-fatty-acid--CoA ligase [Alphaproteobacteria bacterium]